MTLPIPHTIEPRRAICAAGTSAQWPDPPADGRTEPHAYELVVALANEFRRVHAAPLAATTAELDENEISLGLARLVDPDLRNRLTEKLASSWARARNAARAADEQQHPKPAREGAIDP